MKKHILILSMLLLTGTGYIAPVHADDHQDRGFNGNADRNDNTFGQNRSQPESRQPAATDLTPSAAGGAPYVPETRAQAAARSESVAQDRYKAAQDNSTSARANPAITKERADAARASDRATQQRLSDAHIRGAVAPEPDAQRRSDNDQRPEWNNGQHWDRRPVPRRDFHYKPYYNNSRTIVYYQVVPSYYGETYYLQSPGSYTTYSESEYVPGYTIGGYLPRNIRWQPLPDYVRYGLPSPGPRQRWVRYDRDAVLIDAASRIVSGVILAININ